MKTILFLVSASLIGFGFYSQPIRSKNPIQSPKGFAVVELFTSEGCSSCPPADEAVIELAKAYKQDVYVLGFHVDYWDHLGWKDAFSNGAYSKRQQQYGNILRLESIYTPQIIVNGRTEFNGSDKSKLHNAVVNALKSADGRSIVLRANTEGKNSVLVNYSISSVSGDLLNIALIELNAESNVQRGENSGKKLRHINLVRDFKSVSNKEGTISLAIPAGLGARDCKVIAFVQDKKTWQITGAAEAEIVAANSSKR